MGAGNAAAVFARWAHLENAPKLVLLRMALQAKDNDDPPRYWGGREVLAAALGRDVPAAPARGDRSDAARRALATREAGFRAVERAMTQLQRAGAVTLANRPGPGRQGEYHLWISGSTAHGERGPLPGEVPHGERGPVPHGERGPTAHGERGDLAHGERGPEEKVTFTQEREQDYGPPEVTTSPARGDEEQPRCPDHRRMYDATGRALCGRCPDLGETA